MCLVTFINCWNLSYFNVLFPLLKSNILFMYRRQDDLEITLKSRESCITALQNDIGTCKKKLNEAETKLQQELSRSQTLEQELQVLKDKVSEMLEECQQKTDDFLHCQNEYTEVCMYMQTQWC